VGIKVMGTDLGEIEKVGVSLERLIAPIRGTRSVYYERNTGGLYLDIIPNREALARYGLTMGSVERTMEAAIGGAPIGITVEGRNRFSIDVRYPHDLRSDLEKLRQVLVPVGQATDGGESMRGEGAATPPRRPQAGMTDMMGGGSPAPQSGASPRAGRSSSPRQLGTVVPLGQLAEIKVTGGPSMVRDEGGMLVGYVYVDIDPSRDVGGYVTEAKQVLRRAVQNGDVSVPTGYVLKWTGQYELLEKMADRMRIVVPLTLLIIVVLLYLHFRNFTETLIVLLSIPFALVGSVWLLWLFDYRLSTAVWVGIVALVGLAAQTGIVMIVYIDNAYEKRRRAGKIRDLDDIVWAHMEGTVMRVRPKLMTVATMLVGLIPLLWASGSGADVMKRIAAPMVGGLVTSAFLTLEIIPVVYTYWRQEQLLWDRLAELDLRRLGRLKAFTAVQLSGWGTIVAVLVSTTYVDWPTGALAGTVATCALAIAIGWAAYLQERPAARLLVWPRRTG
jgi:copper/silver efflux system protein